MMNPDKRFGITPMQLKLLRDLRARGMAIAMIPNSTDPQHTEQVMLQAAKEERIKCQPES